MKHAREWSGNPTQRSSAGPGGQRGKRADAAADDEAGGPYNEVFCDTCNTLVGVRDKDEVYHFFHVFPSTA
jgi:hypothetical protein